MTEDFLHYVWMTRQFQHAQLETTAGEAIEIFKTGEHNHDAGPDFFNARIRIGATLWAGNVEIHIRSSDWVKHRHQHDKAYENVILHVVYEDDLPIYRSNGELVPILLLRPLIKEKQYLFYQHYRNSKAWAPCAQQIDSVPPVIMTSWTARLLVERLERKSAEVILNLEQYHDHWEACFYRLFVRHFGMKVNDEPFTILANTLPWKTIASRRHSLIQIEALLFGHAGLLPEKPVDEYTQILHREFKVFRKLYKLQPMERHLWKFMRLRPVNFPTIRIAQLAALLHRTSNLAASFLHENSAEILLQRLDVRASTYWEDHYRFGKPSKERVKNLGRQAAQSLVVNAIVPFLFVYGRRRGDETSVDRALSLLEQLEPEMNSIVRKWQGIGMQPNSSFDTQALIQLKNEYCRAKRCLHCGIGHHILKNV